MGYKRYVAVLWKWLWLIALATIIATIGGYWQSSQLPPVYRTTTTLMVGQFLENANPQAGDFMASQQLAKTYVELVRHQPILQATIDSLGLNRHWDSLARDVNGSVVAGTQLIQISVVDTDPQQAKVIADEIARQLVLQSPTAQEKEREEYRLFVNQQIASLQDRISQAEKQVVELEKRLIQENSALGIQDIENQIADLQQKITAWQNTYATLIGFYMSGRINYLKVIEPALVPAKPLGPNIPLNVLLAASIGFVLAAGAAFLIEYLDDTIKTREDVDRVLNLPTLGTVAHTERASEQLVALRFPFSPATEAYRLLRTNVQFATVNTRTAALVVTSALSKEGKTVTACNLSIAAAQAGKRVVLVDADFRRSSVHLLFGLSNERGLTSLLLDDSLALDAVLADTNVPGLRVLPSGPLPPNPADLLSSEPMKKRVDQMKEVADMIVFDSPPVLPVADASILGGFCTGMILVVDASHTRSNMVQQAQATLNQLGLKTIGVVLNRVKADSASYHYYYVESDSRERNSGRRQRRTPRAIGRLFGFSRD